LAAIAHETEKAVERLRKRGPRERGVIKQHRYVAHNQPTVAGTRIPTTAVWNLHQAGYGARQIIAEYPDLTEMDIKAAIAYERDRQAREAG
jgi:uncharacterized protein (DUF433 family)